MFAERYGTGAEVYIALHGWAGSHRDFLPLVRHIPASARIVSVDLPGHGQSPPPKEWTEAEVVNQLLSLQEWKDAPSITLIGFCSGAALALLMADREPQLVRRIVMIDPFAFVPWYFRLFLAGRWGRLAYHITFRTSWGRRVTTSLLQAQQGGREDFTAAFETIDHDIALDWLHFMHRIGRPSRFAHLRMVVDLIYGERTFRAVRNSVHEYCAAFPQSRLHRLAGVGHLPMVRGATQIAKIVFSKSDQP